MTIVRVAQALALQAKAKAFYEKQNYSDCLDNCKEALKLSCNSELLTLVACSQVHCSMLDSAVSQHRVETLLLQLLHVLA